MSLQMEGHEGMQCNSKERHISHIFDISVVPYLALHQFGWQFPGNCHWFLAGHMPRGKQEDVPCSHYHTY